MGTLKTYIVVADGIVSPTGYSPSQPFQLSVFAGGRENAASGSNTDVLVHHGSTDAPAVDVVETSVPAGTIVDNISFPSFAGYLELPTADYTLNITDASGSTVVASYLAPLSTLSLDGAAITVVASGFLDPSQNSGGAPFGLWVATAAGGNLIPLPAAPLSIRDFSPSTVVLYPNPAKDFITVGMPDEAPFKYRITDLTGREISTWSVAQANAQITLPNLSRGTYLLQLESQGQAVVKKIMIE